MLIVIAHEAVPRISADSFARAALSAGGPWPLELLLEVATSTMSVGIRKNRLQKSYDVSADLVIMAGWLHPIPFRTRP